MTDWNTWARIVDAAQDPRQRDAVQQYLAQAELSADIPAALDEKILVPGRSAGATAEQCAYILCNLGFAALVAGTRASAEFAAGCARQADRLVQDSPDLALRGHFLFTKSDLTLAVLAGQPHQNWNEALGRCRDFLRGVRQYIEVLPPEAIESNAMAACSFSAQALSRVAQFRAIEHYADEICSLVEAAFKLADQLPPAFVSRLWSNVMPGTDAAIFFRQAGTVAERVLREEGGSDEHARTGIAYADALLAEPRTLASADLGQIMQARAELLLLSGRTEEAIEQAAKLENSADDTDRTRAIQVRARHALLQGDSGSAAALLEQISPGVDQVLENWCGAWIGDAGEELWAGQSETVPSPYGGQEIWRLQSAAAAGLDDMPGFFRAANRSTGFLADSLVQRAPALARRLRGPGGNLPDDSTIADDGVPLDPAAELEELLAGLDEGTALLQVVNTPEGFLTLVARNQGGTSSPEFAADQPNPKPFRDAHNAWSRACFDKRHAGSAPRLECESAFTKLIDTVSENWGDLLRDLVEDGISQLVLVGDDLVDIPMHAARIGIGDERLIDRVQVTYAPSASFLRAISDRTRVIAEPRHGLELRVLAKNELAMALGEILDTREVRLSHETGEAFWMDVASADVLHLDARVGHNPQVPFNSVIGAGWLDLSFARIAAELDLPHCEIVSSVSCESVLPTLLRAPGFDLSTLFLAAGARNVLTSTWPAGEQLAAEMTRSFFRRWAAGQSAPAAFREALLQMREDWPSLTDAQWACMRLVGAP